MKASTTAPFLPTYIMKEMIRNSEYQYSETHTRIRLTVCVSAWGSIRSARAGRRGGIYPDSRTLPIGYLKRLQFRRVEKMRARYAGTESNISVGKKTTLRGGGFSSAPLLAEPCMFVWGKWMGVPITKHTAEDGNVVTLRNAILLTPITVSTS